MYLSSQTAASDEYNYSTRLDTYQIMLEDIKVKPVTGLDSANFYWDTPIYRIRG